MIFEQACQVEIPFGKYKGKTIGEIGESDEGLLYLDWLMGWKDLRDNIGAPLAAYLSEPHIRLAVKEAIEGRTQNDMNGILNATKCGQCGATFDGRENTYCPECGA